MSAKARRAADSYPPVSLRDLLDARNAYHVRLSNMDNVVATAIGLFRFKPGDPEYEGESVAPATKRTLSNSVVTPEALGENNIAPTRVDDGALEGLFRNTRELPSLPLADLQRELGY